MASQIGVIKRKNAKYSINFKIKHVKLFQELQKSTKISKRKYAEEISDDDGGNKVKRGSVDESVLRDWIVQVGSYSN